MSSKISIWFLSASILIVFTESLLVGRNLLPEKVSSAPVFHLTVNLEAKITSRSLEQALEVYKADRGWQTEIKLENQSKLVTFYFEWDQLSSGSLMHLASHAPEVCNVASGLIFQGKRSTRIHVFPNGQKLSFDTTEFKTQKGLPLHVFKSTWLQGEGNIDLLRSYNRVERLRGSFGRDVGQARVLEGGVFGIDDGNEAWALFQEEILSDVQWTN